jgi:hypothetical protein
MSLFDWIMLIPVLIAIEIAIACGMFAVWAIVQTVNGR